MTERQQLEQAILAQEALRPVLGDAVVEATLAVLRERLQQLRGESEPGERKQATLLFADFERAAAPGVDVSGQDAEEQLDFANQVWSQVDTVVNRWRGRIDKHMGTAVMALWGAGAALEDDPERAIRAALEIRTVFSRAPASASIGCRIGLNTGTVLLGAVGSNQEFTAMGDAVNVASRLQQAAPRGSILISHDTYRHVQGIFNVTALEPLSVKGKPDPLQVYAVRDAKPRSFRDAGRGFEEAESRMVGRDLQLKTLQDAFDQSVEDSETRLVTLVGEAGVGKSRLLHELLHWLEVMPELDTFLFRARGSPSLLPAPYALLRDLLAFRFEIQETDGPEAAGRKLADGLAAFLGKESPRVEGLIGEMVGFTPAAGPPSEARNRQMRTALLDLFAAAAREPTVVVLDDVHWADDRSLDFLAELVRERPACKLLVVCLARPSLFERRPSWGEGEVRFSRIDLGSLSRRDSRKLVETLLSRVPRVPAELRDLVVDAAEGNPFFMEELLKMLVDEGVIVRGGAAWTVAMDRLAGIRVPPTLTGILQARIDGLAPALKLALQRAAVVGRVFWDDLVQSMDLAGEGRSTAAHLEGLRDLEMISRRESSSIDGVREYVFKQTLLRDVAYESVLRRSRKAAHAQVAAWLSAHVPPDVQGLAIADHHQQAGEAVPAAELLVRAGSRARTIAAYREADGLLRRALEVLSDEGADSAGDPARAQHVRASALSQLGLVLWMMGEPKQSERMLQEALGLGRQLGDALVCAQALRTMGQAARFQGDHARARTLSIEGLALARGLSDRGLLIDSLRNASSVYLDANDLGPAEALAKEGLSLAELAADVANQALALNTLGEVYRHRGDLEQARQCYERCLGLATQGGMGNARQQALYNLAILNTRMGKLEVAEALVSEGLPEAEKMGAAFVISFAESVWGLIAALKGDRPSAEVHLRRAITAGRESKFLPGQLISVVALSVLQSREGHADAAAELIGLVASHPAADQDSRDLVELVKVDLGLRLAAPQIHDGMRRGAGIPLDEAILRELPAVESPTHRAQIT